MPAGQNPAWRGHEQVPDLPGGARQPLDRRSPATHPGGPNRSVLYHHTRRTTLERARNPTRRSGTSMTATSRSCSAVEGGEETPTPLPAPRVQLGLPACRVRQKIGKIACAVGGLGLIYRKSHGAAMASAAARSVSSGSVASGPSSLASSRSSGDRSMICRAIRWMRGLPFTAGRRPPEAAANAPLNARNVWDLALRMVSRARGLCGINRPKTSPHDQSSLHSKSHLSVGRYPDAAPLQPSEAGREGRFAVRHPLYAQCIPDNATGSHESAQARARDRHLMR